MEIAIVPVHTGSQIVSLAKIADTVWHETYDPLMETAHVDYMVEKFQSEKAVKEQLEHGNYHYFMVQADGRDIGFTGVVPHRMEESELFLSKAYVLQEYRGCGAFRQIMEQITAFAREKGLSDIWLTVNRQNKNAQAVYEHFGFAITGEKRTDIGGGYFMDDYIMRRKLDLDEASLA